MQEVFLSPLAERKVEILLDYLQKKWSRKVRNAFLEKLLHHFEQVARQPKGFRKSERFPNLYKCVVTKQTSFYYRIRSNEIEIITVIDNRQDPKKIEDELNKWK